ncbi:MAG: hypothetical protein Q9M43_02510 [Sulfurimonas sp.]|nr:hypothetical protein [Sulfurimonas sp.]
MLEYLNYGALGLVGGLGFMIVLMHIFTAKAPYGLYIGILILLGLSYSEANDRYSTAIQSIDDFKNQNYILRCSSGGGLYSAGNSYRVSLKEGWLNDKHYFFKDSLSVRASSCERW